MKKLLSFLFALLTLAALAGCSTLQLEKPVTKRDALAYAVAGNAGVRSKADGSVQAQTISRATGETILLVTDKSRQVLDFAGNQLGVPVAAHADAAVTASGADTGEKGDTLDLLVSEALSAKTALLPVRTVSTMISAAHATGADLTDEAMLAVYGMDDDARAGLVKTLEAK